MNPNTQLSYYSVNFPGITLPFPPPSGEIAQIQTTHQLLTYPNVSQTPGNFQPRPVLMMQGPPRPNLVLPMGQNVGMSPQYQNGSVNGQNQHYPLRMSGPTPTTAGQEARLIVDDINRKSATQYSYNKAKILGQGRYGTVTLGSYTPPGLSKSIPAAVKRIQLSFLNESPQLKEIELMKAAAHHPNILRAFHTDMDENFLYIVMELCIGTLDDYLKNKGIPKNDKEIFRQMIHGLVHLHNKKIIHRDIKPSNILIFRATKSEGMDEPKFQIKLADFGLSKLLNPEREDYTNTSKTNPSGTRGWIAPELYQDQRAGPKVDIFALGLIFGYTLSEGKHPFGDDPDLRTLRIRNKKSIVLKKRDLKRPYSDDDVVYNLIESMVDMDPSKRPTAEQVAENVFFKPTYRAHEMQQKLEQICNSWLGGTITDDSIHPFITLLKDEPRGLRVNFRVGFEGTPLHIVFQHFKDQNKFSLVMKLLIHHGANVYSKNECGQTPIDLLFKHNGDQPLLNIIEAVAAEKLNKLNIPSDRNATVERKLVLQNVIEHFCEKYHRNLC